MELPLPLPLALALPSLSPTTTITTQIKQEYLSRALLLALSHTFSLLLPLARSRYLRVCASVYGGCFFTVHMFLLSYVKSPFIVNPRQSTDKQKTYEPQIRERIYGISPFEAHSPGPKQNSTHPHTHAQDTYRNIHIHPGQCCCQCRCCCCRCENRWLRIFGVIKIRSLAYVFIVVANFK